MALPFDRAPLTYSLLAVIAAVFLAEIVLGLLALGSLGGATSQQVLVTLGANVWPVDGEWWRLVTSMFLHIGLLHLAVNCWALYQLGGLFEIWVGSRNLALVYFAAGIAGSAASLLFTLRPAEGASLSAGASGAIFGILGALISFLVRRRDRLTAAAKSLLMQLLFWAGINVFLGVTAAGIDNSAHMGGFAVGLAIGAFLKVHPRFRRSQPPMPGPPPQGGGGSYGDGSYGGGGFGDGSAGGDRGGGYDRS